MDINQIVSRLEGVIERGDGRFYSLCPGHDDHSPSLSIEDAGDKILMLCRAGCATQDVLAAIGLTFRDLYPDDQQAAYRAATANQGKRFRDRIKFNPLEHEWLILRIAADDMAAGKELSREDKARVQVAKMRLRAAGGER